MLALLVHLASLGGTERRRRVREDPEVSTGAGDRVVGFRKACANSALKVVGDQSAPTAQKRERRRRRRILLRSTVEAGAHPAVTGVSVPDPVTRSARPLA